MGPFRNLQLFLIAIITASLALGIDIAPNLYQNKLNFGYGINFKYNGQLHHNLDRAWIVYRINLPSVQTVKFPKLAFDTECPYTDKVQSKSQKETDDLLYMRKICLITKPLIDFIKKKEAYYAKRIQHILNNELHEALYGLNAGRNPITKRASSPNITHPKPKAPILLDKRGAKLTLNRNPRGILSLLMPAIGGLATIAVESPGSYLQKKRVKALNKAMTALDSPHVKNVLMALEKDFLMYGDYDVATTESIIKTMHSLWNRTDLLERVVTGQDKEMMDYFLEIHRGRSLFSYQLHLYVQTLKEKHLRMYEELLHNLQALLLSIETLSKGYLPSHLISHDQLAQISRSALLMVKKTNPEYDLALPHITSYYDMKLVTFGVDKQGRLIICFPIFIKEFRKVPMT